MVNIIASPTTIGDIEVYKKAGATSVIVGTSFFSVRTSTHFNNDELKQVRKMCDIHNVQMYVLMNAFIMESDVKAMSAQLKCLKECGVDGIYFSDMGVFYEARKWGMEHLMIYNPDTIITNHLDVLAYAQLGLKMCTISKEVTLEDIKSIALHSSCEVELIVHGHLLMMHSKRALVSHYMEHIQSDTLGKESSSLYLMEESREEKMPIVEDTQGTHIYTGYILCSLEEVCDIIDAGVKNIRIEGMHMSRQDVVHAIEEYRRVIERPAGGKKSYQAYVKEHPHMNVTKGFLYKKTGLSK